MCVCVCVCVRVCVCVCVCVCLCDEAGASKASLRMNVTETAKRPPVARHFGGLPLACDRARDIMHARRGNNGVKR